MFPYPSGIYIEIEKSILYSNFAFLQYIRVYPEKLIPTTTHTHTYIYIQHITVWGIQIYNNFYDKDSYHSNNLFVQIVSSDPIKVVFFYVENPSLQHFSVTFRLYSGVISVLTFCVRSFLFFLTSLCCFSKAFNIISSGVLQLNILIWRNI